MTNPGGKVFNVTVFFVVSFVKEWTVTILMYRTALAGVMTGNKKGNCYLQ